MANQLRLEEAFNSFEDNRKVLKNIISQSKDPLVALLALDSLYRMESKVESGQFYSENPDVRIFLREWRSKAKYSLTSRSVRILRSLKIFKTLKVPLFIDDYGKKELLDNYGGNIQYILIDGSTPIYHVTHSEEAQKIIDERQLKPSANKNIIEGCWFGLSNSPSVYGSMSFKTTLSQLGVTGLHQGEIVSYKQEVNVILYAADDTTDFQGLKKPTKEADRSALKRSEAYVKVSIFVPSRFLPSDLKVFSGPEEVLHHPFCVKAKRSHSECRELSSNQLSQNLSTTTLATSDEEEEEERS